MSISPHVHPEIPGFITDWRSIVLFSQDFCRLFLLPYTWNLQVTETSKKNRSKLLPPSPHFPSSSPPPKKKLTQKPNQPQTLSFQNIQTSRVCSLEICMFKPFASGNHFCQILKAEAKQILNTSCSPLVLKSMAKWLEQSSGKLETVRL